MHCAKGCWRWQTVRHVNSYCKDQRRDSRFLNASLCPFQGERIVFFLFVFFFTPAAFSESNHTNLIRVVCPRSCSGCWACSEALVPQFAPEKVSDVHKASLNWPLLFFPSNLIYHTLLVFPPVPLSVRGCSPMACLWLHHVTASETNDCYKLSGAAALVSSKLNLGTV